MLFDHLHNNDIQFLLFLDKGISHLNIVGADVVEVSPELACETARRLSQEEGIFAGISSGAAVAAALRVGRRVENAVIATIASDRGERYLSTGLYD